MKKRRKLSRRGSKSLFKKTADRTKAINNNAVPMRGGFRI